MGGLNVYCLIRPSHRAGTHVYPTLQYSTVQYCNWQFSCKMFLAGLRTNLNQLQTNLDFSFLFQICNSMCLTGENPAGLQTNGGSRLQLGLGLAIILWAPILISIPRYVDVSKQKNAQKGQSGSYISWSLSKKVEIVDKKWSQLKILFLFQKINLQPPKDRATLKLSPCDCVTVQR